MLAKVATLLPMDAANHVMSKSHAFQLIHNIIRSHCHQVWSTSRLHVQELKELVDHLSCWCSGASSADLA